VNYPYWAGRLSGFLKMMKYHKLPERVQADIDELLKEWDKACDEAETEVLK